MAMLDIMDDYYGTESQKPKSTSTRLPRRHSGGNLAAIAADKRASRQEETEGKMKRRGSFGRLSNLIANSSHERKEMKRRGSLKNLSSFLAVSSHERQEKREKRKQKKMADKLMREFLDFDE